MRFDPLGARDRCFDGADLLALDRASDGAVHPPARPIVGRLVEIVDAVLYHRGVRAGERAR